MHPRIQELLDHLDTNHRALLVEVDRVPPDLRATKPGPDRWSVAEVLAHLAGVATGIGKRIGDGVSAARVAGAAPDVEESSVVGSIDVPCVLDRTQKIVAAGTVAAGFARRAHGSPAA